MSGHSKWSTIKHKKAIVDKKRGKLFSILSKNITLATKQGGSGDPGQNPALRLAIDKARSANMPNANIDRAIAKGLGGSSSSSQEEIVYEGYGPAGVGFMVLATTDNRQRTSAEIRHIFDSSGGSLGSPGSTAFLFEKKDNQLTVKVPLPASDESVSKKIAKLINQFKEHPDVETVISNLV